MTTSAPPVVDSPAAADAECGASAAADAECGASAAADAECGASAARALAALHQRFRVVERTIQLGDTSLRLLHPRSAEELISEEDFARDERLPYWADLWPSARVLASLLLRIDGDERTLIELGCGTGLVSAAAAQRSFRVTATDYYEDALLFAQVNIEAARAGHGAAPALRMVDWRHLPEDLGTYDFVVAADVLYERPYGILVAEAVARVLAKGGVALVADPGRVGAAAFIERAEALGLEVVRTESPLALDGVEHCIRIYALRHPPAV